MRVEIENELHLAIEIYVQAITISRALARLCEQGHRTLPLMMPVTDAGPLLRLIRNWSISTREEEMNYEERKRTDNQRSGRVVGAGSHLGIHAASANGPAFVVQDLITYAWDGAATVAD